MTTTNLFTGAALADQIGTLKAKLAPEMKRLAAMEKHLKTLGVGRYQGESFEANVFAGERETLDMAAARAKLSPQFIAAHTTVTETITLKVTARQLGAVALAA